MFTAKGLGASTNPLPFWRLVKYTLVCSYNRILCRYQKNDLDWDGIIQDIIISECSELLTICVRKKACILVVAKVASGEGQRGLGGRGGSESF